MSIDLFVNDDDRSLPPSNYNNKKLALNFGNRIDFNDFKSDPKNYKNHHGKSFDHEVDTLNPVYELEDQVLERISDILRIFDDPHFFASEETLIIVKGHLNKIVSLLSSHGINEAKDIKIKNTLSFKEGVLKLQDGTRVKIDKSTRDRLNNVLKGTKYPEKLFATITKNKKEFDAFNEYSLTMLDESYIDKDLFDYIKDAGKVGGVVGKFLGGATGISVGIPYGLTKTAIKAYDKRFQRKNNSYGGINEAEYSDNIVKKFIEKKK